MKQSNFVFLDLEDYSEWPETGRCFITVAFKLCFGISHEEGPRESGRAEIDWNTPAFGLY
jgi:hypothetical protein